MAFVFCLSQGGQNFLSGFSWHLGKGDLQSMFPFLDPSHETDSSSGALFFAQWRARNASDTRVIGDEAQGIVGRRKMIDAAHLNLPPSCLVCPPIFIKRKTFVYEAAHEMCY